VIYKNLRIISYETLLFNTDDGDIGLDQYAEDGAGTGYFIRTAPKDQDQFTHVGADYDVSALTKVNVIEGKSAYYHEFLTCQGAKALALNPLADLSQITDSTVRVRAEEDDYKKGFTHKNHPVPYRREKVDDLPADIAGVESKNHHNGPVFENIAEIAKYSRLLSSREKSPHSIAFDATSNSGAKNSVSSYSFNHTCGASASFLACGVSLEDGTNNRTVSGVTYNGVALTSVRSDVNTAESPYYIRSTVLYLRSPATGSAYSVAVTLSGSTDYCKAGVVSYSGANNLDANAGTTGNSTTETCSITTTVDNCWTFAVLATRQGSGASNQSSRWSSVGFGADSGGPITPAGAKSMSWSNPWYYWAMSVISIAPMPSVSSSDSGIGTESTAISVVLDTTDSASSADSAEAQSVYGNLVMVWDYTNLNFVPYTIANETIKITKELGSGRKASFTVIDKAEEYRFYQWQAVKIYDTEGVLKFSGVISAPKVQRLSASGGRTWSITCRDWSYIVANRYGAGSYSGQTAGYIMQDLVTRYLSMEGITVGDIQDGATFELKEVDWERLDQVFDDLAEQSNYIWYIDDNKQFYFIDKTTYTASWTLTNSKIVADSKPTCEFTNSNRRNIQYVKNYTLGSDPSSPTTDRYSEIYPITTPQTVFFLNYIPSTTPSSVTIDGVAKTIGILGTDICKDFYWQQGGIMIVAAEPLPQNSDLEITYIPTNTKAIIGYGGGVGDLDSVYQMWPPVLWKDKQRMGCDYLGGSGLIEHMITASDISKADAYVLAEAGFGENHVDGAILRFATEETDLEVGQLLPVNLPNLELDSVNMLVESIATTYTGAHAYSEVTCTYGSTLQSWRRYWKTLTNK